MLDANNYDLAPINHPNIDVARTVADITNTVVLTFEPGDMTRYRVVLHYNEDGTLTIERHPAYGALCSESSVILPPPNNDADRLTASDLEPISNNNVHTSHMLAILLNNFLDR